MNERLLNDDSSDRNGLPRYADPKTIRSQIESNFPGHVYGPDEFVDAIAHTLSRVPYEDVLGLLWSTVFVMSEPDEVVSQPRDALRNMGLVVVGDEVLDWTRDDQADALLRHIARFILHGHDMRSVVESELLDTGLWDRKTGEFVGKVDNTDSGSENDSTADVVVDADADADAEFNAEIDQAEKLVEQWLVDWRNYHRNDDHLWN